jgi:pimeloyl-ACP methyl ester carboxylesterase
MSDETEILPFRVDVPDEAIADLRRRIAAVRWPGKALVADRSQRVHFHEADRDGHFAAWEEPELFATEIRAAFTSLR